MKRIRKLIVVVALAALAQLTAPRLKGDDCDPPGTHHIRDRWLVYNGGPNCLPEEYIGAGVCGSGYPLPPPTTCCDGYDIVYYHDTGVCYVCDEEYYVCR
jgi:hypothetical protein